MIESWNIAKNWYKSNYYNARCKFNCDRKSTSWWENLIESWIESQIESWNKARNWYKSNYNDILGVNFDRKSTWWWKNLIEIWIESQIESWNEAWYQYTLRFEAILGKNDDRKSPLWWENWKESWIEICNKAKKGALTSMSPQPPDPLESSFFVY